MSTPSFKYGNGVWATKEGSSLAYNDDNGNYKPLPFSVSRASSATRVNKQGLIEVVGNDRLRIDYSESANGVALLEPSRSNVITYSDDINSWTKINVSVASNNSISPDGSQNADKLTFSPSASIARIVQSGLTGQQTGSFFYKKGSLKNIMFYLSGYGGGRYIDTQNNLLGGVVGSALDCKIISYPNGWYKVEASAPSATVTSFEIYAANDEGTSYTSLTFSKDIYIWGAQLEAGSYATSYIPTSGSTATRQADVANGAGVANVFNDSEGVLYADIAALADDGTSRVISINDGGSSDYIHLRFHTLSNTVRFLVKSAGTVNFDYYIQLPSTEQYNKIAIEYDNTYVYLWANGFKYFTYSPITTPIGLSTLNFDDSVGGDDFYGKAKGINVYQTALTDAELEYLTSYRSLAEMATELNLNAL